MRNPFTMLYNKITDRYTKQKMHKKDAAVEVEVKKHPIGSSGGGKAVIPAHTKDSREYAAAEMNTLHNEAVRHRKIQKKLKKARKVARRSRRINRLHRQFHKAA